ncbi:MAG: hypothetical protein EA350_02330 [Gemmatimonadales bacterium]|nr:MAG: hypothetical protein EA350_02330 [Gemmatimonadales bacterium]
MKRGKLGRAERQAGEHGVQLSQADGDYAMGPVSRAKGEFEFVRLTKVIDSIRQYGYVPQTRRENISGYIMEADGDWAVMIQSGSHRAPALYALGWRSVPVLIKANKTVRRQELASWPCVRNGQMTPEEALKLFDRVLREEDPAWLKARWCDARRNASG